MESYGILSVVPLVLSLILAVYTRNIIIALTAGALSGTFILNSYNPFFAIISLMRDHVFVQASSPTNTQVLIMTFTIGGFVHILEKSGGARAFSAAMVKLVSNPVKGQLAVWISGISIFFSDTANSLVVGPLYRPVFDRLKICREKLGYIIDTTAAPVVILIPVGSWGVYIMSLIENSYANMGIDGNAFDTLLSIWPYQFYAFLALLAVPMIISTGKDFGPMAAAQKKFDSAAKVKEEAQVPDEENQSLMVVILPISIMIVSLASILGYYAATEGVKGIHVNAGLCISYVLASMGCAYVMKRYQKIPYEKSMDIIFEGMGNIIKVAAILTFAWVLSSICRELQTGEYLATFISGTLDPMFLPVVVFFIGAIMSFATGSSWGTFAIMMATTLPIAQILGADLVLTIAAIISGGLFGDHTSPISDTSVLASMGAGCPHIDHVSTQLPYALITGAMAISAFVLLAFLQSPYVIFIMIPLQYFAIRFIMHRYGE
jgi:Na+/H+ antiporter NhaC